MGQHEKRIHPRFLDVASVQFVCHCVNRQGIISTLAFPAVPGCAVGRRLLTREPTQLKGWQLCLRQGRIMPGLSHLRCPDDPQLLLGRVGLKPIQDKLVEFFRLLVVWDLPRLIQHM